MSKSDIQRRNADESDDSQIEHCDVIETLDQANEAVIAQGMALQIQPAAPLPSELYFVDGDDWKRQTAGQKVAVTISVPRETVKAAIAENDESGGNGVKAVDPSRSMTDLDRDESPNEPKTEDDTDAHENDESDEQDSYVDLDAVVPSYRIKYRESDSDPANGSMAFSEPKTFVMDIFESGDGFSAGVDSDGRDIVIHANKRINVRDADEDGAYRFLGYFRGFEEVQR